MNSIFPIIELIDRLAIAELKMERTGANSDEYNWYKDQISKFDISKVTEEYQKLLEIHKSIWDLEADLRLGAEGQHTLEEIGRRAIEIRNFNNQRVWLKNIIAEKLSCPVREIKINHISA